MPPTPAMRDRAAAAAQATSSQREEPFLSALLLLKALRESRGQAGTAEGHKRAAEMVAERWVECCPSKIKPYLSLLQQQHGRRSPGLLNEGPFATNETWPVAKSAARMAFLSLCPGGRRKQFPPRFLRLCGPVGAVRGVETSDSSISTWSMVPNQACMHCCFENGAAGKKERLVGLHKMGQSAADTGR